jgi:DNA ligase-1
MGISYFRMCLVDDQKKKDQLIHTAGWNKGDSIPYSALCKTFGEIEKTTKRLEILKIITHFFMCAMVLSPDNVKEAVYLCVNQISPS